MSLWRVDFSTNTNEDWVDTLALVDQDDNPYDLTGSSLRMQIRVAPQPLLILLELSTANDLLIIEDPVSPETYPNKITVYVPEETLASKLNPGSYVYDMVWTKPDGRPINLMTGSLTVVLGVTRDDN